ncbi:MAG: ATP-grasp domain-containing protein [Lachnospiraceae bacterium]|nr:ATP-grasp domain-containing protein [Lachnospiraceae bacterium]
MIAEVPDCGVNYAPEGIPFCFFDPDNYPSASMPPALGSIFINRSRDAALTKRLEEAGFTVYNDPLTAELGNDKLKAIRFMEGLGIPVMKTYEKAPAVFPFIMKTTDGHGGDEVFLIKNEDELKDTTALLKGRRIIYQEFCDTPGRDKRVYIVGNKAVAAMLRISDTDFRSNYSLGGDAEISELTPEESSIVDKILSRMTIGHAGIDLIYHKGHPVFNELEDVVGSRMLYRYTDIDVVKLFVEHILSHHPEHRMTTETAPI